MSPSPVGLRLRAMQTDMTHTTLIVGAGPAGLAAAAELGRAGVPAVVLERAEAIGAAWRGRYDRLRLNTSRLTSRLPAARYRPGTSLFPTRDEFVRYLDDYAERDELDVRLGTRVDRLEPDHRGWTVRTSAGDLAAAQVIVATGYEHTPHIPELPGRECYGGRLMHAAEYRTAEPFRDLDLLIVGPGSSGIEIAYDLATGGARRVRLAVRTPPNILLRAQAGLPGDLPALAMLRLPPAIADAQLKLVRRLSLGDLTEYGLAPPAEGVFARLRRDGKTPAIIDRVVLDAIKRGQIEIVAAVDALDAHRRRAGRWHPDRTRRDHRRDRLPSRPRAAGRTPRRARSPRPPPRPRRRAGGARPALHRLPATPRADPPHGPRGQAGSHGHRTRDDGRAAATAPRAGGMPGPRLSGFRGAATRGLRLRPAAGDLAGRPARTVRRARRQPPSAPSCRPGCR